MTRAAASHAGYRSLCTCARTGTSGTGSSRICSIRITGAIGICVAHAHARVPVPSSGHELLLRCHGVLRLLNDAAHGRDSLHGEVAHGHLAAEHHGVAAVEHGVGHVAGLRARGEGLVLHGGQHLGGRDHVLAGGLGLLDHHLLRHPDLLHRDLHAQVAASHHDAVGLREDLVEVPQALDALDLGNDLDGQAAAVLPALPHVLRALHEAQRNVVGLGRHGPLGDVEDLALVHHGDVDAYAGHVHVLLLAEAAVVQDLGHHVVLGHLRDLQDHGAVLHQDPLARLHVARELAVGDGDARLVALLRVVAAHELEALAGLELLLGVVDLELPRADLRAARVHEDLHLAAELRLHLVGLHEVCHLHALLLVVAVRHVAADGVHARLHELRQDLGVPGLGADGADDVRLLLQGVDVSDGFIVAGELHDALLEGLRRTARGARAATQAGGHQRGGPQGCASKWGEAPGRLARLPS
mmetsp:Transcript_25064/g.77314  ORF Transcript_25064/g.77314 Transcript_25064/m.77314 type:complete len:469 (-) Transcript_25064:242-1648(-)